MEEWALVDIYDDLSTNPDDDRWLLIYQVPAKYAPPDGEYSVSMPKSMITDFAATYAYDLDNPEDVDALWDHLIHLPYLRDAAALEGRIHETTWNPYTMTPQAARQLAAEQLAEFKQAHRIVEQPKPALKAGRGIASAEAASGLLGALKQDMVSRADPGAAQELAQAKGTMRVEVQDQVMELALRMNESRR